MTNTYSRLENLLNHTDYEKTDTPAFGEKPARLIIAGASPSLFKSCRATMSQHHKLSAEYAHVLR